MRVGIAAAGSGGHVYPALAVAEALVAMGIDTNDVVFFGGSRMEATTIPDAGYQFVELDIHGFKRSVSTDNLRLALKVRKATKVIETVIDMLGLDVMVVFGGYISGPAAQAARRRSIPLVVHEANAVPGMANRMIAGRADLVLVASEEARDKLKGSIVVGNPLRASFDGFDRSRDASAARHRYGIEADAAVLGIVGGSLGAATLNAIAETIARTPNRSFHLLHLCGPTHGDEITRAADSVDDWTVVPFEDDMVHFYAASDLVISRSGALTVAEIEVTATPAIVVPLPAGKGYQQRNAAALASGGGALMMNQDDPAAIVDAAFALMADQPRRELMSVNAGRMGHRHAATEVAKRVLEVAGG
ncbi:MAG: UDP-N-acetylglucosamine--N-acetylmuramyl-(pentapeptide) pyrophosphoryl-undecaprenol N-acetylglucosamine transferase [Armatimonadetes bacterium]|nr:MAG: UDP-N-acetylglucosamine--N-acetylmuramyl-(pentapeptide) pyrophosphoryl-undecaprenol N-acetylglucosamine transferase [Armatimonadota bacterium]